MLRAAAFVSLLWSLNAGATETTFDVHAGDRTDQLNWSIAANAGAAATPNIRSELTWTDVRIRQIGASWKATEPEGLQLRAALDYGRIAHGRNQDSDYLGDNRTLEESRSNNDTNDDYVWDAAFALGLRNVLDDARVITPFVGLSHHAQHLRITNGNQTIPADGPFPGLDTTYRAQWTGPFVGFEAQTAVDAPHVFFRLEYHWARYRAKANWNLRPDFDHPLSFKHDAGATGRVLAFGLASAPVLGGFVARLTLHFQRWSTDPGTDRAFRSDGTSTSTRLNEVEWTSRTILLGIERNF